MQNQKYRILLSANSLHQDVWEIARQIGNNPEEGYKEYEAARLLTNFLEKLGFSIEKPLAGIETAFRARFQGSIPGPRIVYLAEYDALPDIGHACGHNLIGAASVGAAAVLSTMAELPGEVVVVGSPAEETSGAKVALTEAGIFHNMNAALMFHPGSCNVPEISSLAMDAIEVTYLGKTAHMAVSDSIGINALEALLSLFHRLDKLKSKLAKDERIDGIITEGGKSPNIVPGKAAARFYLRAGTRENLNRIRDKFIELAHRAGEDIRAQMRWCFYECSYDEMKTNSPLAHSFRENLLFLGVRERDIEHPQTMLGSVDMGNVSHVVPAIHAYLRLGKGLDVPHTIDFAKASISDEGEKVMALAVRALALTGWDVLHNIVLREKMQKDFLRARVK